MCDSGLYEVQVKVQSLHQDNYWSKSSLYQVQGAISYRTTQAHISLREIFSYLEFIDFTGTDQFAPL